MHWVPFALTHAGMLNAVYLGSCRQLALRYESDPSQYRLYRTGALRYKIALIQVLQTAIARKDLSPHEIDAAIACSLLLASDEVSGRSHPTPLSFVPSQG